MLSGENLWLQYKQSVVSRGRGSSGRAMYGILGVGGREREREEGEEGRGRRETDLTSLARQMSVISFKSAKIENTSSSAVKIFSSRHNLHACAEVLMMSNIRMMLVVEAMLSSPRGVSGEEDWPQ